jgi:hypothetical protein
MLVFQNAGGASFLFLENSSQLPGHDLDTTSSQLSISEQRIQNSWPEAYLTREYLSWTLAIENKFPVFRTKGHGNPGLKPT